MRQEELGRALTTYQTAEVRRALSKAAGLEGNPPASIFRFVPPRDLFRLDAEGAEIPVDPSAYLAVGPAALRPEGASADDMVIPIEPSPGSLWGHWVLSERDGDAAATRLPDVLALVRHLVHLEEVERLRSVSQDLLAVFGLGHALVQTDGPSDMVQAIHTVTGPVLRASCTALALGSEEGGRLYRYTARGGPDALPIPPGSMGLLPAVRSSWGSADPNALQLASLTGDAPSAGMAEPIGEPERPAAVLILTGGAEPFTSREQGLFARVADFVLANLVRWEQLEGVRRKSRQVADLFVMLAQEKERLDFILRSVPVGILLAEGNGAITVANEPAAKALGLTEVELKESKIFSSRPEGRALLGFIEKARAEKRAVSTPYEMEGRWFQVQVLPWPGGAQFLVVTQDIQDWYQLNRLKEDLISVVSHEVKNPLTAIVNAADLLNTGRPGPLTEPQARISGLILETSLKIRSLLDDVVRLSRVTHLGVERERVPLKALVLKIAAASQDTVQGKLLNWREELDEVAVMGEPRMLENLLTNLIGNAVKYAGIGGHVGVRLWAEGGRARFRVMDDGPGIPAKERERLFSPFFRASNVREQVAGTGLGLVIARNVAERMGGRVEVASPLPPEDIRFLACPSVSPGTAFQVDLPLE